MEAVYVDDTCCILRKGDMDWVLHHLNSMHTPDHKIHHGGGGGWISGSLPFLDTKVTRKEDGKLNITVYCKQTHADRYLHFRSHQLTHAKRGMVRCLYNHTRCIAQQGQYLKAEENHLMKAFMRYGYPRSFIRFASAASPQGSTIGKGRRRGHPLSTSLR